MRGVLTDIDDTLTTRRRDRAEGVVAALRALRDAGLPVFAVTGRPMGWSRAVRRADWPLAAIVAENGAVALFRDGGGVRVEYAQDAEPTRARQRRAPARGRRAHAAPRCPARRWRATAPAASPTSPIDHSEFAHLDAGARSTEVVALMRAAGMNATVSSIHVNGWFGAHTKLSGARWIVRRLLGRDLDAELDALGLRRRLDQRPADVRPASRSASASPTCCDFADRLTQWPAYMTAGERGRGFAEVAERAARRAAARDAASRDRGARA